MDVPWLESLTEDWITPQNSIKSSETLISCSDSISDGSQSNSCRKPEDILNKIQSNDIKSSRIVDERHLNLTKTPRSNPSSKYSEKLLHESNLSGSDQFWSQTTSISSSQPDTINYNKSTRPVSSNPQETLEWKKRILQGDIKQCDLFSPSNLEIIFTNPSTNTKTITKTKLTAHDDSNLHLKPKNLNDLQIGYTEKDEKNKSLKSFEEGLHPKVMKESNDVSNTVNKEPSDIDSINSKLNNIVLDDEITIKKSTSLPLTTKSINESDVNGSRTISGQSISKNEQLSQIILVKQSTEDGRISFTPTDLSFDRIRKKIKPCKKMILTSSLENQDSVSKTLSDNLATNGYNVTQENSLDQIQEAKCSQDFISKNADLLKSQSLPDESALLPEESMQASTPKDLSSGKVTHVTGNQELTKTKPMVSSTPHSSPTRPQQNDVKKTSHSPLKIFDKHDTFTNEKLLRRLSQFECELADPNNSILISQTSPKLTKIQPSKESEGFIGKLRTGSNQSIIERKSSIFRFGDFNDFQFEKLASHLPLALESCRSDKEVVSPDHLPKIDSIEFSLNLPSSSEGNEQLCQQKFCTDHINTFKRIHSYREISQPLTSPLSSRLSFCSKQDEFSTPRKRNGSCDGKRLPKTPLRHPFCKRRRTLYRIETNDESELSVTSELNSAKIFQKFSQPVLNRKQATCKQGHESQIVKLKQSHAGIKHNIPCSQDVKIKNHSVVETTLNSTKDSSVCGNFMPGANQDSKKAPDLIENNKYSEEQIQIGSRKASVPTNEYIDEAKKIMANLRRRNRSLNALTIVEESDTKINLRNSVQTTSSRDFTDGLYQESSLEPFSRPPSREGAKPIPRPPKEQVDPAIIDHLRKYEENFDVQSILASSQKSIAEVREAFELAKKINRLTEEKIRRNSNRRSTTLTDSVEKIPDVEAFSGEKKDQPITSYMSCDSQISSHGHFQSVKSHASCIRSLTHSIPTGTSKELDNRRVIAPESVSHLIPERLAGMVFLREQNTWVKKKSLGSEKSSSMSFTPEATDDDPFVDISDLSIDETLENERIKIEAAKKIDGAFLSIQRPQINSEQTLKIQSPNIPIKNTIEENVSVLKHSPSKNKGSPQLKCILNQNLQSKTGIFQCIEEENSTCDERIQLDQTPKEKPKRNITVSFSSPMVSFIETQEYQNRFSFNHDKNPAGQSLQNLDKPDTKRKSYSEEELNRRLPTTSHLLSPVATPVKPSIDDHHFTPQPISRIDERNKNMENTLDHNQNNRSFSIVFTKSIAPNHMSKTLTTPRPLHEIGTLTLTPLSDFTINQVDQTLGLDVSYLAQPRFSQVENTKKTLSSIIRELVEKITEAEPYEPHWEHLREINLKGKRLKSVHKLDNFCQRLKELDISNNQISHLDGVPRTVQNIRINDNCLSDLTAWGHLTNLQYIDVSNNNLESLSSLKCLVHLRSLRADNNKITSLDGIDQLNGLLTLRMRNNYVRNLNFQKSNLKLLIELDLRNNQVCNFENIHQLSSLTHLDLVDNNLTEFSINGPITMKSLKYIRLCGNKLESIYVGCFPNLRLLYLDRNHLGRVMGMLKTKYLDSLSLREQCGSALHPSVISEAFEVRKLFLSGNFISKLQIESDFLNLQYLELANCGLESLPEGFGSMLANVRVMNLNFNALTDIQPISGILRLKKLYLAGNRLTRLGSLTKLLFQVPTLSTIDLRGNPLTMGFHSPILMGGAVYSEEADSDGMQSRKPYTLGKIDKIKDSQYVSCLDMRTRMKRRIYEINLIRSALRLKVLDGLLIDRSVLFTKDKVYDCMVEAGFVAHSNIDIKSPQNVNILQNIDPSYYMRKEIDTFQTSPEIVNDEIWQAEDSFA